MVLRVGSKLYFLLQKANSCNNIPPETRNNSKSLVKLRFVSILNIHSSCSLNKGGHNGQADIGEKFLCRLAGYHSNLYLYTIVGH